MVVCIYLATHRFLAESLFNSSQLCNLPLYLKINKLASADTGRSKQTPYVVPLVVLMGSLLYSMQALQAFWGTTSGLIEILKNRMENLRIVNSIQ